MRLALSDGGQVTYALDSTCPVPATKQRVRDLLERLPDDCSLDDVVYHLYVIQKIEAGLADAEAGRLIPHDVVAAELRRKWTAGSEL